MKELSAAIAAVVGCAGGLTISGPVASPPVGAAANGPSCVNLPQPYVDSYYSKGLAEAFVRNADWERYSQSPYSCWLDDNSGQTGYTDEGIDCTSLLYKAWGLNPSSNTSTIYRLRNTRHNTRTIWGGANFYTGTFVGTPDTAAWGKYKTASEVGFMDALSWDGGGAGTGHALVVMNNHGGGWFSTLEAVGSGVGGYYGTGMNVGHFYHSVDVSNLKWGGYYRKGWV
jgi:hypothetical protein